MKRNKLASISLLISIILIICTFIHYKTDERKEYTKLGTETDISYNVSYTKTNVKEVFNILNPKMIELEIKMISQDDLNEKVYIYLNDLESAKIDKIKSIIDYSFIEFRKLDSEITFD